jgi:PTS system nitrogen regulatory IIA component
MDKLLTVQQIAEYLQIKPSTIYQWTHQAYIPHLKPGNLVRFRLSQVDRWLEKKTKNGPYQIRKDQLTFSYVRVQCPKQKTAPDTDY